MYQRLDLKALGIRSVGPLFQSHDPLITLPEPPENEALDPNDDLTNREREVLEWCASGKSDWQIGQILNLSPKTVNYHIENSKRKLRVSTRIQAIVVSVRQGHISGAWDAESSA